MSIHETIEKNYELGVNENIPICFFKNDYAVKKNVSHPSLLFIEELEDIENRLFVRGGMKDTSITKHLGGIEKTYRGAIIKVKDNHSLLMLPIIPYEVTSLQQRIAFVKHSIVFLQDFCETNPIKICFLSSTRKEWLELDSNDNARRIYRENEILKNTLLSFVQKNKYSVEFMDKSPNEEAEYEFELNEAIKVCNLIVGFSGAAGNIILRSIRFMSREEYKLLSVPWFHLDYPVPIGEGHFAKEDNFENHIKAAVAWGYMLQQFSDRK